MHNSTLKVCVVLSTEAITTTTNRVGHQTHSVHINLLHLSLTIKIRLVMPFGITRHLSNITTHLINSCQHSLITIRLLAGKKILFFRHCFFYIIKQSKKIFINLKLLVLVPFQMNLRLGVNVETVYVK